MARRARNSFAIAITFFDLSSPRRCRRRHRALLFSFRGATQSSGRSARGVVYVFSRLLERAPRVHAAVDAVRNFIVQKDGDSTATTLDLDEHKRLIYGAITDVAVGSHTAAAGAADR